MSKDQLDPYPLVDDRTRRNIATIFAPKKASEAAVNTDVGPSAFESFLTSESPESINSRSAFQTISSLHGLLQQTAIARAANVDSENIEQILQAIMSDYKGGKVGMQDILPKLRLPQWRPASLIYYDILGCDDTTPAEESIKRMDKLSSVVSKFVQLNRSSLIRKVDDEIYEMRDPENPKPLKDVIAELESEKLPDGHNTIDTEVIKGIMDGINGGQSPDSQSTAQSPEATQTVDIKEFYRGNKEKPEFKFLNTLFQAIENDDFSDSIFNGNDRDEVLEKINELGENLGTSSPLGFQLLYASTAGDSPVDLLKKIAKLGEESDDLSEKVNLFYKETARKLAK